MKKLLMMLLMIGMLIGVEGCATVINTPYQEIVVTSTPPGAIVRTNNTEFPLVITTPDTLTLKRNEPIILTAKLRGYKTAEQKIYPESLNLCGLFGNLILAPLKGPAIGVAYITDCVTSSEFELKPSEVHFELVKIN